MKTPPYFMCAAVLVASYCASAHIKNADEQRLKVEILADLKKTRASEVYVFPSAEAINMPLNALFEVVENTTGRPVTRAHVFVKGEILRQEYIVEDLQILINALNQDK